MKTKFFTLYLLFSVFQLHLAAQKTITGTITDAKTGEAIMGATVLLQGTTNGTSTTADGHFELTYTGQFPVRIQCSFVGYGSQLVEVQNSSSIQVKLEQSTESMNEIVVTSRRRKEVVQDIPIPISVLNASQIENSQSFNVNRIKELVPSVQLYSSNPRNTTINIRGLGSTFGLTNDGIDPGVGFYVDGVYYARPAATTLDFIDVEQVEVLRGPQGTLFGKNTTAGTFNITTRKPGFNTGGTFEVSFGNYGFVQGKATITGPLVKEKLAARFSFSGTHRDGTILNVAKMCIRDRSSTSSVCVIMVIVAAIMKKSQSIHFALMSAKFSLLTDFVVSL